MMEVKHSPSVPHLDFATANSDSNSADTSALLKGANVPSNLPTEKLQDDLLHNGTNLDDELDFQDAVDDTEAINSDLEDALLADDDLLTEPKTNFSLENLDKAENSTDPGDDLDKLLSKINDVVEGSDLAIGNETKSAADDNETRDSESIQVNGAKTLNNDEEQVEKADSINEQTEIAEQNVENDIEAPMEVDEENSAAYDEDVEMKEDNEKEEEQLEMESESTTAAAVADNVDDEEEIEHKQQQQSEDTQESEAIEKAEEQEVEENKEEEVREEHKVDEAKEEAAKEDEAITEEQNMQETSTSNEETCTDNTEKPLEAQEDTVDETNQAAKLETSIDDANKSAKKFADLVNAAVNESLEEGEIADDDDKHTDSKSEEIFTLVLDDDDEDDVVETTPSVKTTSETKPDKKIDQNEDIVCLDDDDEDDELVGTKNENKDEEQTTPKTEETGAETAAKVAEDANADNTPKEVESNEKVHDTEAGTENSAMKAVEMVAESQSKNSENIAEVTDSGADTKLAETESETNAAQTELQNEKETVIEIEESKDSIVESADKQCDADSKDKTAMTTSKAITEDNEAVDSNNKNQKDNADSSKLVAETANSEQQAKKAQDLISDNTDNACDGLESSKEGEQAAEGETSNQVEDDARSDSSGSNLLQEGQAPSENAFEEADEEDAEDAEVDDSDDVELLEGDVEKTAENENKETDDDRDLEIPPAKRLRLSTDSEGDKRDEQKTKIDEENDSNKNEVLEQVSEAQNENEKTNEPVKMQVDGENVELKEATATAATTNLKRSFLETTAETEELSDDKTNVESAVKKQKTSDEDLATPTAEPLKSEESVDLKPADEATKPKIEELADVKKERLTAVPSNKPIPLYPPPKFEETPKKLGLDFLQRFRKTFNQMTKNDLEELVLQKVVEALVYENQFADLRMIIEKQEKVIDLHRSKLAQLVKQYRDLEMVHTRVVKDMKEKNSQYLMPVRITRAVGLQVSSPTVRGPVAQVAPNNVASASVTPPAAGLMRAPQNHNQQQQQQQHQQQQALQLQQQKRLASPQRPQAPAGSNVMLPSTTAASPPTAAASAAATAAQPVRRGCMQKVTAQRPVNGTNASSSTNPPMASIPASSYARPLMAKTTPTTSPAAADSNTARLLNKNASQAIVNNRMRYGAGNVNSPSTIQQAQQVKSPPQILNRQNATGIVNAGAKINAAAANKMSQPSQYRWRQDASPNEGNSSAASKANTSTAYMEQYKNSFNQAMPTNVSITPARPKDKSVIDLTDEDDAPTTPTQPIAPPPTMTPRARVTPQSQQNVNVAAQNRQNMPPSLTRMPSSVSVRPQITPRQLSSMQTHKQQQPQQTPATITTASGMSITRVAVNQANPATQRLRHPAPLPPTPPQTFNPGWKLPPPRPTIRISNLDNGIVISWTMEEPLDRHAEVTTYQIYAYQETNSPPTTDSWRHVGDVKAMLLPMAVTLTQFQEDQRYFFSVRAIDAHQRYGPFSAPKTWN